MKLLFTTEWLKRKIATDPDVDCEAGGSALRYEVTVFIERMNRRQVVWWTNNLAEARRVADSFPASAFVHLTDTRAVIAAARGLRP